MAQGWRPACERTASAARRGFRTAWSPADPRVALAAWPLGPPPAMVRVTRPAPRLGYRPVPPAQAPRRDLPVAMTQPHSGLGLGPAAAGQVRPCHAESSDLTAERTENDEVPGRRPAVPAPVRRCHRPRSNRPAGTAGREASLSRHAAPPQGLRWRQFGRRGCRPRPACLGALWPCPTSGPPTRCDRPRCRLARTWPAAGPARPGRLRPPAAPP